MTNLIKATSYGFLIVLTWFVVLFVMSFVLPADQSYGFTLTNLIAAGVMGWVGYRLARRLHPSNSRQGMQIGSIWVLIELLIVTLVAIGNGTESIVFGNWSVYLTYIAVGGGAWLAGRYHQVSPHL
ncbi:MAG: hypothetical protein HY975_03100 [Candidatus Kerfeldbacteria bacterium]|nr:hypothetical protein [Candidatus Kerfeldbacteria bacterium]